MAVLGVQFQENGKEYSFASGAFVVHPGDYVVVDTPRGIECGRVTTTTALPRKGLKAIRRLATKDDRRALEQKRKKEARAFDVCREKIALHRLDMRLVGVECLFDNSKLLFYFTAEKRVDFRDLVRDLASVFHIRIELRQIGVRDKAKMLGGYGICGREFCCKGAFADFQPVSIRMAKDQGLSLNPAKISGCCGRLMCCLKYEQRGYEQLLKITPRAGSQVLLEDGRQGKVLEANPLSGTLRVLPAESDTPVVVNRGNVTLLKGKGKDAKRSEAAKTKGALPDGK